METPSFATHYYLAENGPFRSLSELPHGADDPVFLDLLTRHQKDLNYRRRYGREYLKTRKATEARLRELFIARGGKPKSCFPLYFTLGESPWFRDLNADHDEIRIALADLPQEATSLTFPDSLLALNREDKPYYNQVFLLKELDDMVERFGVPSNDHLVPYERYWESDFELYIEIQVWDDGDQITRMA